MCQGRTLEMNSCRRRGFSRSSSVGVRRRPRLVLVVSADTGNQDRSLPTRGFFKIVLGQPVATSPRLVSLVSADARVQDRPLLTFDCRRGWCHVSVDVKAAEHRRLPACDRRREYCVYLVKVF